MAVLLSGVEFKIRIKTVAFRCLEKLYMIIIFSTVKGNDSVFIGLGLGTGLVCTEIDDHIRYRISVLIEHMQNIG